MRSSTTQHRYGLEVIGAVIPSLSTQAQPSAKDVNALVGEVERYHVKAIFPESTINPKLAKAVARESGATAAGALWADTLPSEGSSGATYVESVDANTQALVAGLSGGAIRCDAAPGAKDLMRVPVVRASQRRGVLVQRQHRGQRGRQRHRGDQADRAHQRRHDLLGDGLPDSPPRRAQSDALKISSTGSAAPPRRAPAC